MNLFSSWLFKAMVAFSKLIARFYVNFACIEVIKFTDPKSMGIKCKKPDKL